MKNHFIYIILLLSVITSCTTKFTPEIDEFDKIIVVEGLVTNENRSNIIKINRTVPVGITGISSPVVDAHVYVIDDQNNVGIFRERKAGVYASDSLTFQAEVGRTYTLHIITGNREYQSEPVLMRPVPEIDSIYAEFEYIEDGVYPPLYKYSIFFNTYDSLNENPFYRWTYEEVWEYHLPWHYPPWFKSICWLNEESEDIMIKNYSSIQHSIIEREPLTQVDNRTSTKLWQKYSILLKQYSINEEEYRFWDRMSKTTNEQGGLYDPIPQALTGNIISLNDPAEPVLGYFSVSAVSEKRLFIQNDTIKHLLDGRYCVTDTASTIEEISGLGSYVFILEEIDDVGFLLTTFKQCADCRVFGTNVPPPYWNDDK